MLRDAYLLWKRTRDRREKGTTLYLRLFSFFAFMAAALLAAVCLVLTFTGFFRHGVRKNQVWFESELKHVTTDVRQNFGELAVQGVTLSEQLSRKLEADLKEAGLEPAAVQDHPAVLEPLLKGQLAILLPSLRQQTCGGAFVILDATIQPDSGERRSGLFLKRTIPNAVRTIGSKFYYLRGPSSIARENGVELLGQWQMEFTKEETAVFDTVVQTARENPELPLSRLYFWSHRLLLSGNSEAGIWLCIPLRLSDGTVFGICGFELSAMLFKQEYSPDNSVYTRVFSVLAPEDHGCIRMDSGLLAGNSYLNSALGTRGTRLLERPDRLTLCESEDQSPCEGLHSTINLYPSGSPYRNTSWIVAVLAPSADVKAVADEGILSFQLGIGLVGVLSIAAGAFISRRYITPVLKTFEEIKRGSGYSDLKKTKYLEINDLLEFLAAQDEAAQKLLEQAEKEAQNGRTLQNGSQTASAASTESLESAGHSQPLRQEPAPPPAPDQEQFLRFLAALKTLTPAEERVFALYAKEYKAKDIAAELCLSMNTIKYHNGNIYSKLEVNSRKELLTYIRYMQYIDSGSEQRNA